MSHAIVNIMKPNDFFEEVELQLSDDIIGNWFGGDISNTKFFKPKKVGAVCSIVCFNATTIHSPSALYVSTNLIKFENNDEEFFAMEMDYACTPLRILSPTQHEYTHIVFTDNTYIAIRAPEGKTIPENLEAWLFIDTSISYYHK